MKVLAIIPARFNSSRFPGKPLIDILGKTMIERVYERTKLSKLVNEVVVATDDQRIYDEVIRFGGKAIITAQYHKSGTERCGEVISHFPDYDVIINIQGDEPLIDPSQIDDVLELFNNNSVQIGTAVKAMTNISEVLNPNRVKAILNKNNQAIYFSRSPIPHIANQPEDKWLSHATFWKHIGIYAWKKEVLQKLVALEPSQLEGQESLEQLRWLFNGFEINTVKTSIETPNIDTPEDLELVLEQLKRK